jgi:hypothetical protein
MGDGSFQGGYYNPFGQTDYTQGFNLSGYTPTASTGGQSSGSSSGGLGGILSSLGGAIPVVGGILSGIGSIFGSASKRKAEKQAREDAIKQQKAQEYWMTNKPRINAQSSPDIQESIMGTGRQNDMRYLMSGIAQGSPMQRIMAMKYQGVRPYMPTLPAEQQATANQDMVDALRLDVAKRMASGGTGSMGTAAKARNPYEER